MKYSSFVIALSLASQVLASPVPAVKWVTEYEYTTVTVGFDAYTAYLASASSKSPSTHVPNAPATKESSPDEPDNTVNVVQDTPSQVTPESRTTEDAPVDHPSTQTPSVLNITPTSDVSPTYTSTSSTATGSEPSGSTFSGEGTYYDPEMGACGKVNSGTEMVVAVSHELYDKHTPNGNPNKNSLCGKKIRAFYEGSSVEVSIVDRCVGCAHDDLDLSPSAFEKIADKDLGRINLTWEWVE